MIQSTGDKDDQWKLTLETELSLGKHIIAAQAGDEPISEDLTLFIIPKSSIYSMPEDLSLNDVVSADEASLFAATSTPEPEELLESEIDVDTVAQGMSEQNADLVATVLFCRTGILKRRNSTSLTHSATGTGALSSECTPPN